MSNESNQLDTKAPCRFCCNEIYSKARICSFCGRRQDFFRFAEAFMAICTVIVTFSSVLTATSLTSLVQSRQPQPHIVLRKVYGKPDRYDWGGKGARDGGLIFVDIRAYNAGDELFNIESVETSLGTDSHLDYEEGSGTVYPGKSITFQAVYAVGIDDRLLTQAELEKICDSIKTAKVNLTNVNNQRVAYNLQPPIEKEPTHTSRLK